MVAVIAGGAALGYLLGNTRLPHPAEQGSQPPVSATLTPAPKLNPSLIHPHLANGNYTAPGAPRIVIEEQRQPILRRVSPPPAPAADPEASQEATVPVPKTTLPPQAAPATGTPATPSTDTPATTPTPAISPGTTTPAVNAAPPSPPPAPADPDFEHVNGAPAPADPEAGQQGGRTQNGKPQTDTRERAQFRVQTGAYTDESNARSVADTLRSQGFSASTRSERDGDHLVYKVQVGAFRSKDGASKAAGDLQKKGYPAFISPMIP